MDTATSTMEHVSVATIGNVQRLAPAPIPARQGTEIERRILFTFKEVVALTGLSKKTLGHWLYKRWVNPATRSKGGRGREHMFSGWQTVALTLLNGALHSKRQRNEYIGSTGVQLQMDQLSNLDDSLLLPESMQDPKRAEQVAAEIHSTAAMTHVEISPETYTMLAGVINAIERKARHRRSVVRLTFR
jgi:hypothetical protein